MLDFTKEKKTRLFFEVKKEDQNRYCRREIYYFLY